MGSDGFPYAEATASGDGALSWFWVQLSGGLPYPIGGLPPSIGHGVPRQSLSRAPFGVFGHAFQLLVGNAFGIARSETFTPNRFLNLAGRAVVGTAEEMLVAGFSIGGPDLLRPRTMLIRAIGPGLASFGVTNTLEAPTLSLFAGSQLVATNAGWDTTANAAAIRTAAQIVGAFPLAANSADCALLLPLVPGNYTAQVTSPDGSLGVALVEVYDTGLPDLSRLKNLSARAHVQGGTGMLIGGLVIAGGVKKAVLLRAAGPTLANFGLHGVLAQPMLTLFKDGAVAATATRWGEAANAAQISATAKTVSAFPFPESSADSAMLLQLEPGAYTLQVIGADGGSGVAMVEIYEIP